MVGRLMNFFPAALSDKGAEGAGEGSEGETCFQTGAETLGASIAHKNQRMISKSLEIKRHLVKEARTLNI